MPRITKLAALVPVPRVGEMLRLGVKWERSCRSWMPLASTASCVSARIDKGVLWRLVARRSAVTMISSMSPVDVVPVCLAVCACAAARPVIAVPESAASMIGNANGRIALSPLFCLRPL
jgi:hypothetical protein